MGSLPASTARREGAQWTVQERVVCWQCGAEPAPGLFCSACKAIQPLPEQADYFEVLGVPRHLVVDSGLLQRRYYELHRCLHPDRYQIAAQAARVASLRNTATVNRAYRTLRDLVDRGLYWLTLQGESLGADNNRVPPELAALVFDIQEQLEELRAARRAASDSASVVAMLRTARTSLRQRETTLLHQLEENFASWDAGAADPAALRQQLKATLSALAYLRTLLRDVDKELES